MSKFQAVQLRTTTKEKLDELSKKYGISKAKLMDDIVYYCSKINYSDIVKCNLKE
jgi:predicted DNA-binding protein